ncbi:hypothetical protein EPI11_18670, partial [Flavobacterium cerinum]
MITFPSFSQSKFTGVTNYLKSINFIGRYFLLFFISFWHIISYANNDECSNAIQLTPGIACNNTLGTFQGMTLSGTAPGCDPNSSQDVWYKFTATEQTMSITAIGAFGITFSLGLEIREDSCSGPIFKCVSEFNGAAHFAKNFVVGKTYFIRVYHPTATLIPYSFNICVQSYPPPANDICANAAQLTPNAACVTTTGSFSGSMMNDAAPLCATTTSQDVWYKFTATEQTMSITAVTEVGTWFYLGLEIREDSCSGPVFKCIGSSMDNASHFANNFVPGKTYFIRVFNPSAILSTYSFTICVRSYPPPVNDICSNAVQLTPNATCVTTTGSFSGSMMNGTAPSCASTTSQDIWYKFIATDQTMSISIAGVSFNTMYLGFEIFEDSCSGPVFKCIGSSMDNASHFANNFVPGKTYLIRVFNPSATLITYSFTICVRSYPPPVNDICSNAVQLTPNATCVTTTGSFSGSMMNGTAPSCASTTSQDIWYKFIATDQTMSISIAGVSFNTMYLGFEIFEDSCSGPVFKCIGSSMDNASHFANNFVPGKTYFIRVFNPSATLITYSFTICVRSYPTPVNDVCANAIQLTPNAVCVNTDGSFSGVMMNGTAPACAPNTSQDIWYKFTATDQTMSVLIAKVTFSTMYVGFEILEDSCSGPVFKCIGSSTDSVSHFANNFVVGKTYFIRVINPLDTIGIRSFTICVQSYPTPVNDVCANAIQLTPNAVCVNTDGSFSGVMMNGTALSCASTTSQDIWYKFTATDQTMSVLIAKVTFSTMYVGFEILEDSCSGPVFKCIGSSTDSVSHFANNFVVGKTYFIRVINPLDTIGIRSFTICVRSYPPPVNDVCANAIQLMPSATCVNTTGTFSGVTMDAGIAACAPNTSQDVWYKFVATSGNMGIQLAASNSINHGFQVFEGSCNGTVISCINNNGAGLSESVNLSALTIGATYFVRVINASATINTSSFSICLTGPPPVACTPSVTISASTVSICSGVSVTFNAIPTYGGSSPSYQWKVNGNNVGTNSSSYTTSTLTNGSIVSCVMTSSAVCAFPATATSNTVSIAVSGLLTPEFTQIPAVCLGQSFTLPTTSNNGISGTWSPVVNTTATTIYTFTPNAGQCASTAAMTVTVNNITPGFTQIPAVCLGQSFTLPTISNNGIAGTWSPAVNNTATTTYTFTPDGAQCASAVTMTVTVNAGNVVPTFTQVAAICPGQLFVLPAISNNGINGTWSPGVNNTATTTYTFTPNAGQCASASATMTVTVNTNSITPVFTQVPAICPGQLFVLPATSNNGINGTWSPGVNNTATTTYTFTPNGGQCASATTMTVTVNTNSITPVFTQVPAICPGQLFVLPTTSNNGIIGTWSPVVNNTATTTYTFTPNGGQCASAATMTVTVNTNNTATPVFTQIAAICSGQSFVLPTTSNNGIIGTWSPVVNNTATTTYTFTPNGGQCASAATMTVTVNTNNTATPVFTQIAAICSGQSF